MQTALFDLSSMPEREVPVARARVGSQSRQQEAKLPAQIELKLKWARKIAFKRRFHEDPNATNDHHWSLEAIHRLHLELFNDWENRFPAVTVRKDVLDYWTWMLADSAAPFAFRDVLIVAGYRRPDALIEALPSLAPDWVLEALGHK